MSHKYVKYDLDLKERFLKGTMTLVALPQTLILPCYRRPLLCTKSTRLPTTRLAARRSHKKTWDPNPNIKTPPEPLKLLVSL